MIHLENVTLMAITGVGNAESADSHFKALMYSSKDISFKKIKLLSSVKPTFKNEKIEHILIKNMTYNKYSDFVIKKLNDYVDTKFVLLIQDDGFIINPELWDDRFLDFDYIGAPWINSPHYNHIRVGNGGFSLRSKKFLEICQDECIPAGFNEDHVVCVIYRDTFLKLGLKYAPIEIAAKFSFESKLDDYENSIETSLGFHGKSQEKYLNLLNLI